jgi:D-aminoacyl-tRNA deacylase
VTINKFLYFCNYKFFCMRVVIQRVKEASVLINGKLNSKIGEGLLILVGIETSDSEEDSEWLAGKVAGLRVFDDDNGVMNKSVLDIDGEVLIVSQFTLHAMTKKGNRPSYIKAAKHEIAIPLYEHFCNEVSTKIDKRVQTGVFAADMQVSLINNGPITILMDSRNKE